MPGYNPDDYNLAGAFAEIEHELMESMMRNMRRHQKEEEQECIEWSQWQAEQLRDLERYRLENKDKFTEDFKTINDMIADMIRQARATGKADEEISILEAIQMGWNRGKKKKGVSGEFFKQNDRKMNALIKATTQDMEKAEHAILRKANDEYRKTIFNAVAIANTGSLGYDKCIDIATRDMRRAGLRCVEYKNGSRHSLEDYADMVIKTTTKRAYLTGEGEMRAEWGISTVILNKRSSACPLCLPWVGKVMIDDVWSNGGKGDGKYPLLSHAIAEGLYHPRCKDSHTTFFPGISTEDSKWTKKELQQLEEENKTEAKQKEAERQAKVHEREAEFALDPEEKQNRQSMAEQSQRQANLEAEKLVRIAEGYRDEKIPEVPIERATDSVLVYTPAETIEEAQSIASQFVQKNFMDMKFNGLVDFKGISLESANQINQALSRVYGQLPDLEKLSGIKAVSSKAKVRGKAIFADGADAVMAYDPIYHGIYINKDILKSSKAFQAYNERANQSWDIVMNNIDKLSGKSKEVAMRYKEAGRQLVAGDSVEDLFIHELGHHVQWTMLDVKTNNTLGSRMMDYARGISGYAASSKSEYLAESFVAFIRGENNNLDPEYIRFLQGNLKSKRLVLSGRNLYASENILFTDATENAIIATSKQIGNKSGKHLIDFGLNPEIEEDRKMFLEITRDIIQNATEKRVGSWRSQPGESIFYIKGENVVVVNNGTYVTTLKGGVRNERVKNARKL